MSPIAFSFLLLASVTMVTEVQSACQSYKLFATQIDYYKNMMECLFPESKLAKACVMTSCPSLAKSKLCPTKSGSFDSKGVAAQINKCFSSMATLCGTQWDPHRLPQNDVGVSMDDQVVFSCTIPVGSAMGTGLNRTRLDSISPVSGSPNTYTLAFTSPNITVPTTGKCTFNIPGDRDNVSLTFTGGFASSFKSTATVHTLTSPPTVHIQAASNNNSINIVPPAMDPLSQEVLKDFVSLAAKSFQNDLDDVDFTRFVSIFVAYALQVLADNCLHV